MMIIVVRVVQYLIWNRVQFNKVRLEVFNKQCQTHQTQVKKSIKLKYSKINHLIIHKFANKCNGVLINQDQN